MVKAETVDFFSGVFRQARETTVQVLADSKNLKKNSVSLAMLNRSGENPVFDVRSHLSSSQDLLWDLVK